MLTKEKAAALIIDSKTGGDPAQPNKYDTRIVYYWIDIARAKMISEEYTKKRTISDSFLKSFVVSVKDDSVRNQRFFDFPVNIISITHRYGAELGIYRVSATKSNKEAFSIIKTGMNDIFDGLDGGDPNKTSVQIESNKGYFENLSDEIKEVRVTLVPSLEGIGEKEPIPIPGDRETDLIIIASQLMDESKGTIQDKTNDNNSQQI